MNDDERTGPSAPRRIRSYVRRAGRLTTAQQRALQELWPEWGVESPAGELDLDGLFGRRAPRVLEIGFGNGETLVEMARAHPDWDFLGIEVHEPGIGHCLLRLQAAGLGNLRLVRYDAVEVLESWLPAGSVDRVHLFFPDPWPKKRHHKRRLVQPAFVALAARVLKTGGILHIATDWADYAEHIETVLGRAAEFESAPATERPVTKFERRGQRLGHEIRDLVYRRRAVPARRHAQSGSNQ